MNVLLPEILLILRLPYDMLKESLQLMFIKNPADSFTEEKVNIRARKGSKLSEFFDLFRITFTPMSLVTRRESFESWRVHRVNSASEIQAQKENKGIVK